MNILLNDPMNYQDWTKENNEYLQRIENNQQISDFWNSYYSENKDFKKEDIQIYKNIIPDKILEIISEFSKNALWKYNYKVSTNELQYYQYENIKYEEIKKFSVDLYHNIYFKNLFYEILLPNLNIENKEKITIDRIFMSGRLHGLSDFLHKDDRSSEKIGPSIYIFLNDNWKCYYDGSLLLLPNIKNNTNTVHVEHELGKIVMFPPNLNHKFCEISGYGLLENVFSKVLEYHLIYI